MVHHEILATPSIAAGRGVFTFYAQVTIAAPASEVYAAIRDFQSYPKWNLYTTQIDTPSGTNEIVVDEMITLHYRPEPNGKTMEVPCKIISFSDVGFNMCWKGCAMSIPDWLLWPEKVQTVIPKGENECLFRIYETQGGPLAYVVKYSMGAQLSRMNQGIADGLKAYVEGNKGST